MSKLPDFEGLAIFAKVVELRSFSAAANELALSKATISKAVTRVEDRLGARLFNRTSRRLALTDAGRQLAERAAEILAAGEAAESEALAMAATPRGLVRMAAPMSFGLREVTPLLPEFFNTYPEVSVDLHLSDAQVDLIGEGFDIAVRIAALPDSSLVARRLCPMKSMTVAAPSYLERRGRPTHPLHLAEHDCLRYAYLTTPDLWRFTNTAGEEVSVRPNGRLRVNNGDAMLPALVDGRGIAVLPEFIVGEAVRTKQLEVLIPDWSMSKAGLHLVTPSAGPRPARVEALLEFLAKRLSRQRWRVAQEPAD
jgi:DNA-binding transcriptional LysR family regulator